MAAIITVGEVLIDLTQTGVNEHGIPQFSANPGGAPANVAVAAARLGANTGFIGAVGNDGFGQYLKTVLEENGVDTTGISVEQCPTTMAIVSVSPDGERSFQFVRGADRLLHLTECHKSLVKQSKILHFGSVSLTTSPAREATLAAAQYAKEQGVLVSYDPNYRAALWSSEAEAREWMQKPLSMVDIIKISDEEISLITGKDTIEEAGAYLESLGIKLILITLGGEGAYYRCGGVSGRVDGVKTTVADTNGAGDTFFGAFLSTLGETPDLHVLTAEDMERKLCFANTAAAITCSRSGAIPAMPRREEVEMNL